MYSRLSQPPMRVPALLMVHVLSVRHWLIPRKSNARFTANWLADWTVDFATSTPIDVRNASMEPPKKSFKIKIMILVWNLMSSNEKRKGYFLLQKKNAPGKLFLRSELQKGFPTSVSFRTFCRSAQMPSQQSWYAKLIAKFGFRSSSLKLKRRKCEKWKKRMIFITFINLNLQNRYRLSDFDLVLIAQRKTQEVEAVTPGSKTDCCTVLAWIEYKLDTESLGGDQKVQV